MLLLLPIVLNDKQSICKSTKDVEDEINRTRKILIDHYNISITVCAGPEWTRVGYLNMSDKTQKCPSPLSGITDPVRGCGRSPSSININTCDSITFYVDQSFSKVCGRIYAYQESQSHSPFSTTRARPSANIDHPYVSGLSLTHGKQGHRQHVWTFAAAPVSEATLQENPSPTCHCNHSSVAWPHKVPSFVGSDYFCDDIKNTFQEVYTDNLLWDGKGCRLYST